jgi:predicted Fe-S protein YdhL (DUF1289 family)
MMDKGLEKTKPLNTKSPCVSNCCLNEDDVCLGCFRHIEEIVDWKQTSNEGRITILERCKARKKLFRI